MSFLKINIFLSIAKYYSHLLTITVIEPDPKVNFRYCYCSSATRLQCVSFRFLIPEIPFAKFALINQRRFYCNVRSIFHHPHNRTLRHSLRQAFLHQTLHQITQQKPNSQQTIVCLISQSQLIYAIHINTTSTQTLLEFVFFIHLV